MPAAFLQDQYLMANRTREKGQSTIEFILSFSTSVGFIFLFFKMATNFADGYMVHHATFLASRSYLVNDQDRDSVEEGDDRAFLKARSVFQSYLPEGLVQGVNSGALKESSPGDAKFQAFIGVWAQYSQKFSLGFIGGKESVLFTSESFLGREPTRVESRIQVCEAIKFLGLSRCDVHVTLDDNGG